MVNGPAEPINVSSAAGSKFTSPSLLYRLYENVIGVIEVVCIPMLNNLGLVHFLNPVIVGSLNICSAPQM